jgi:crotonobetainyl-CoA:carnitine CoA-transferase CaiB-like acyl-CoA transferase
MKKVNVPAMRVNRIDELLGNPQLQASGLLREREHPTEGKYIEVGLPVRFSAHTPEVASHAASKGQHSQEVADELGVRLEP